MYSVFRHCSIPYFGTVLFRILATFCSVFWQRFIQGWISSGE